MAAQTPFLRKPITILLLIALFASLCYATLPFIEILTGDYNIQLEQVEERFGISVQEYGELIQFTTTPRMIGRFTLHLATSLHDANRLALDVCGAFLISGYDPFQAFKVSRRPNYQNYIGLADYYGHSYFSYSSNVSHNTFGLLCNINQVLVHIVARPKDDHLFDTFLFFGTTSDASRDIDVFPFSELPIAVGGFRTFPTSRFEVENGNVCVALDPSKMVVERANRFQVFVNDILLAWLSQEQRTYSLEEYQQARGSLLFQDCTNDLEDENILRVDSYLNDQFVESHSLTFYGP